MNGMNIELRKISDLRPHPENARLFDTSDESLDYEGIRDSIKKNGLWEPIVIKEDGTILSGHLRVTVMRELGHSDIKCRVMSFLTYKAEVTFLVRSNTDRRQLSKAQMARAFELLKRLPAEQGGAKQKRGGTCSKFERESGSEGAANSTLSSKFERESGSEGAANSTLKTRDAAAAELNIGRNEAEALSTVFVAPPVGNDTDVRPASDVPNEVQKAVEQGKVSPTAAAKQIKSERKRQGGEIKDPSILQTWVGEKTASKERRQPTHEERIEQQARAFNSDVVRLANIYKDLDDLLSHRPLKSVVGPSEHQRFSGLLRDVAIRCARELESVQASESVGRQVSLIAIAGGKL